MLPIFGMLRGREWLRHGYGVAIFGFAFPAVVENDHGTGDAWLFLTSTRLFLTTFQMQQREAWSFFGFAWSMATTVSLLEKYARFGHA